MNLPANSFQRLVLLGIAQANYQAARLHAFHNIPLVVWDEQNNCTKEINARDYINNDNIPVFAN